MVFCTDWVACHYGDPCGNCLLGPSLRAYEGQYIRRVVDFAKGRDEYDDNRPSTRFVFFRHKKTGELFYRKIHILDLRWHKYAWQKRALTKIRYIFDFIKFLGIFVFVMMVPRRQGKTWLLIHTQLDLLLQKTDKYNFADYFCLEKEQALRNAKEAIFHYMQAIPSATFSTASKILTIPFPTLKNPSRRIYHHLNGVRGGVDSKRGGEGGVTVVDEADGFQNTFIKRVAFISASNKDGFVFLSGTDFGLGVLRGYLSKAKYIVKTRLSILAKKFVGKPPAGINNYDYFEEDSYQTKVYTEEKLEVMKDVLGEDEFSREFMNVDKARLRQFYFQGVLEGEEYQAQRYHEGILPDPRLPVYMYYDIGRGDKTDKMAIVAVQHAAQTMRFLWGTDFSNATIEDPVLAIRDEFPFKNVIIKQHVLPHDAGKKASYEDNKTVQDLLEDYLKKHQISGDTRKAACPSSKKASISTAILMLQRSLFNRPHATELWEAMFNHRKKELAEGIYGEEAAKTPYRDLADTYILAANDHYGGDHLEAGDTMAIQDAQSFAPRPKITETPELTHDAIPGMGRDYAASDCFGIMV